MCIYFGNLSFSLVFLCYFEVLDKVLCSNEGTFKEGIGFYGS